MTGADKSHAPLLVTDGLAISLRDGQKALVSGVSLKIEPGVSTMIVGQSGSGKSLTLRAILGLLPRSIYRVEGTIIFDGKSLGVETSGGTAPVRGTDITMIFQDPAAHLNPLMTIGQHLTEIFDRRSFLKPASRGDSDVRDILRKMRFPDPDRIAASYPHQLSGGQKQRAMIALALAPRPKLLLADEPTSSLDATVQREIMDLIEEHRREMGLTFLMVTHDIGMAFALADHVYVMDEGRIADAFDPNDFDRGRARPETLRLLDGRQHPVTASAFQRSDMPMILKTDALSKTYHKPEVLALEPISLTIGRGTIVAIVGESGSGKTTLGRLLVGLAQPSSGAILADGHDAKRKRPSARAIQMIFQDPATSLDPDRPVASLLIETMKVNGIGATNGERREMALELLSKVGLPPGALERRPAQFSGGERQRIAIARALSVSPEILICDESVSALDAHMQGEVLALLSNLRRDLGLTILFITHDLNLVADFADEMVVLKDGQLVEMGPTNSVFHEAKSPYTRKLIAAQYRLPAGV